MLCMGVCVCVGRGGLNVRYMCECMHVGEFTSACNTSKMIHASSWGEPERAMYC